MHAQPPGCVCTKTTTSVCLCACVQVLVITMIKSLPMLLDVLLLALFHFSLFTVITLNIFAGKFAFRCVCCMAQGGCKQRVMSAHAVAMLLLTWHGMAWHGVVRHALPPMPCSCLVAVVTEKGWRWATCHTRRMQVW